MLKAADEKASVCREGLCSRNSIGNSPQRPRSPSVHGPESVELFHVLLASHTVLHTQHEDLCQQFYLPNVNLNISFVDRRDAYFTWVGLQYISYPDILSPSIDAHLSQDTSASSEINHSS